MSERDMCSRCGSERTYETGQFIGCNVCGLFMGITENELRNEVASLRSQLEETKRITLNYIKRLHLAEERRDALLTAVQEAVAWANQSGLRYGWAKKLQAICEPKVAE